MTRHVSEEGLLALVEGGGTPVDRAHAADCPSCAARRDEARGAFDLARGAMVPEPPPLYWEAFRRNLGRRLDEEPRAPRWRWGFFVPLAAAAALAVAFLVPWSPAPVAPPAPVLPVWSALPPADQDEDFVVLEGLSASNGDLAALDEGRGLESFVAGLTDEESKALAASLRGAGQEGDL